MISKYYIEKNANVLNLTIKIKMERKIIKFSLSTHCLFSLSYPDAA